jgi:hypothetical protein
MWSPQHHSGKLGSTISSPKSPEGGLSTETYRLANVMKSSWGWREWFEELKRLGGPAFLE